MTIGHNSGISAQKLQSFIQRIERLEDERTNIGADIREVYSEAKADGFDAKIMREVIKARKMDSAERIEREELLAVYLNALGDLASTPLGASAMERL